MYFDSSINSQTVGRFSIIRGASSNAVVEPLRPLIRRFVRWPNFVIRPHAIYYDMQCWSCWCTYDQSALCGGPSSLFVKSKLLITRGQPYVCDSVMACAILYFLGSCSTDMQSSATLAGPQWFSQPCTSLYPVSTFLPRPFHPYHTTSIPIPLIRAANWSGVYT